MARAGASRPFAGADSRFEQAADRQPAMTIESDNEVTFTAFESPEGLMKSLRNRSLVISTAQTHKSNPACMIRDRETARNTRYARPLAVAFNVADGVRCVSKNRRPSPTRITATAAVN